MARRCLLEAILVLAERFCQAPFGRGEDGLHKSVKRESAMRKNPYDSLKIQISNISDLAEMGSRFSKAVSVDHLLSLILKQAMNAMDAEVCIIWLKDKAGNLIPHISFGLSSHIIQSVKLRLGVGLVKCIMKKDHPTNIYELSRDKRVPLKRLVRKEGLVSLLAEPLVVEDERIGVLMICTRSKRRFTVTDLKVFEAVAKQSALAIADIGLYDRMDRKVRQKVEEISMLFTMSRSITSSINSSVLLETILEKTRTLMKAKVCTLNLIDKSRSKLELAAGVGLGAAENKDFRVFEGELAKKVVKSGMPLIINEIATYTKNIPAFLKRKKIHSIAFVPLFSNRRHSGVLAAYMQDVRFFEKAEVELFGMVASLCSMAVDNAAMIDKVRKDYFNSIKTLAEIIDANDTYTRGHCDKVMKYSIEICKRLNLDQRDMNSIKTASMLHDIGKIGVDLSVIRKEGKLNDEDWAKIRRHPEIGARIVRQVGFLSDIVPIIKHHHSKFSGGGYPDPNRRGERIPIGARIIAVADAYDAMTSDRPYRKAMSHEEAVSELKRCSGTQFDPKVVDAFTLRKI
ncbi:MAG: GAF domain-containing protein [Candidatus Omnitrophica bacterium]|nr:GAF domain-containing protein [Candidatus Omnitrophota bacterium]